MHEPSHCDDQIDELASWNGRVVPAPEARLPVWDLGVVLGAAVTEMIRTFHHRPFRFEAHLDRLERSIATVGFPVELNRNQLVEQIEQIVDHNSQLIPATHDLGIVVFVTAGANQTYLGRAKHKLAEPGTVCGHTFPLAFELWADKLVRGQILVSPPTAAPDPLVLPPGVKYRSRLHWYLADQSAQATLPGSSALLRDAQGCFTETSAGNFFTVIDEVICTPKAHSVLGGISQQVVRELAESIGISYRECDLRDEDLGRASEAFTSSTPVCLLPVYRVNDKSFTGQCPGPVFHRLMDAWNAIVDLDIMRQITDGARDRTC